MWYEDDSSIFVDQMPTTKSDHSELAKDRDLYSGLIRLHVLHHAVKEPIFGLGMIEELARHGYRISPGTLYKRERELAPVNLRPVPYEFFLYFDL
jgi:hypothetical protein